MKQKEIIPNHGSLIELLDMLFEIENTEETDKSRYIEKLRKESRDLLVYGTNGETIITL